MSTAETDRFTSKVKIDLDEYKLQEECRALPQDTQTACIAAAERQYAYDKAKAKFEEAKATLDREIRDNPLAYGLGKATESSIAAVLVSQPEYLQANRRLIDANYDLRLAQADVEAMQTKKRSLSLLVELYVRDYYSNVGGRMTSEEAKEFEKRNIRSSARRRLEEEEGDT